MFRIVRVSAKSARVLSLAAVGMLVGTGGVFGQEPATSGITEPRGPVRVVNDPLRERSAAQNIVFGRIISSDEHRLILREGEGEDAIETEVLLSPKVRVYLNERPVSLSDLPPNARVRVPRSSDPDAEVAEVFVVDEQTGEGNAPQPAAETRESAAPVGLGLVMEADPAGVKVVSVRPDGPAHNAGIRAGDEIVSLNEKPVGTPEDVLAATGKMEDGAAVTLKIRRDGTLRDVSVHVTVGPAGKDAIQTRQAPAPTRVVRDESAPRAATSKTPEVDLGATLETTPHGIEIVQLDARSPLADAGLKSGDFIKDVAGKSVVTPDGLFRVLNNFDAGATVELIAVRNGHKLDVTLVLPENHKKVLVDPAIEPVTAARRDISDRRTTAGRVTPQLLEQIQRTQEMQQQQLKYLYDSLLQLAEAAGVGSSLFGTPTYPFGVTLPWGAAGFGAGAGSNVIGFDAHGNPVIGFTRDGIAVAIVGYDSNGNPILDETTLVTPANDGANNDVNNDGIPDVDTDGDGIADDFNGDGVPDLDRDGDGFPPRIPDHSGEQQPPRVEEREIRSPIPPTQPPFVEPLRRGGANHQQRRSAVPNAPNPGARAPGAPRGASPEQPITPQAPQAPAAGPTRP